MRGSSCKMRDGKGRNDALESTFAQSGSRGKSHRDDKGCLLDFSTDFQCHESMGRKMVDARAYSMRKGVREDNVFG
uniref:Uncharacterized protein n=1 Tax=Candidatus Kentrum sp. TC TaxID=2126339 RepID=A0A451A177_9GAMM|nr:MAG: hypothetical protein BECKTC1821F_GA0114240_10375 [Candidatus Kentron sp. TC]